MIETGIIFSLFVLLVGVFFAKKKKTKLDFFAFCGVSALVILLIGGIFVSYLIRPLMLDRYLFPLCGCVWIFIAVEGASIRSKWVTGVFAGLLCYLSIMTFEGFLHRERQEGKEFNRFRTYFSEKVQPDDLFIYPEWGGHVSVITYLFPEHTAVIKPYTGFFGDSFFFEMLHSTRIDPDSISDSLQNAHRSAWVFVPADSAPLPEMEFCGIYGWGWVDRFALYFSSEQILLLPTNLETK
jgi:hypothetical protein